MYGKVIKKIRNEHGLTQEKFAEKIGTTKRQVSLWENDIVTPTKKKKKIEEVFGNVFFLP